MVALVLLAFALLMVSAVAAFVAAASVLVAFAVISASAVSAFAAAAVVSKPLVLSAVYLVASLCLDPSLVRSCFSRVHG